MKPDSFEELLSRCSAKFSGGADSEFIARRLFTLEGFELEEAEEVLDGDTVVVSAGEDFIQPSPPPMALQPSLASHSTLSSGGSASELQALASRAVLAALAIPPTNPVLDVPSMVNVPRLWRGRAHQASLLTWPTLALACSALSGGATEPLGLP